jgi:hypothetical protein
MLISLVTPMPTSTPATTPERAQDDRLREELDLNPERVGADRLPNPDLSRVRSRTDTSIMFMIPIPPTEQGNPAEREGENAERRRRPLPLLDDARLILCREVVRIRRREIVLTAEGLGDRVEGGLDLAGAPNERVDVDSVDAAEQHAGHNRKRDEEAVVEILVGELPSAVLNPDHVELAVADAHGLADRALAREEVCGRDGADAASRPGRRRRPSSEMRRPAIACWFWMCA